MGVARGLQAEDHRGDHEPGAVGGRRLYFASNPRSGPTGGSCLRRPVRPGDVAFSLSLGSDGGFVFGRVGDEQARTIEIRFPDGRGTLTARVGEQRFFLARLTRQAQRSLTVAVEPGPKDPPTKDGGPLHVFDNDRIAAVTAVARAASGATIARGTAAALPEPGGDGTTTSTP
jgi:hypothetical protein